MKKPDCAVVCISINTHPPTEAVLRQAHLPIREGSIGINSSNAIKRAAYIGRHALVLGHVVAASAQGNFPSFLERLPERLMVSALLEELNTVDTEVKKAI